MRAGSQPRRIDLRVLSTLLVGRGRSVSTPKSTTARSGRVSSHRASENSSTEKSATARASSRHRVPPRRHPRGSHAVQCQTSETTGARTVDEAPTAYLPRPDATSIFPSALLAARRTLRSEPARASLKAGIASFASGPISPRALKAARRTHRYSSSRRSIRGGIASDGSAWIRARRAQRRQCLFSVLVSSRVCAGAKNSRCGSERRRRLHRDPGGDRCGVAAPVNGEFCCDRTDTPDLLLPMARKRVYSMLGVQSFVGVCFRFVERR